MVLIIVWRASFNKQQAPIGFAAVHTELAKIIPLIVVQDHGFKFL